MAAPSAFSYSLHASTHGVPFEPVNRLSTLEQNRTCLRPPNRANGRCHRDGGRPAARTQDVAKAEARIEVI
jgi:hypothetical protein